MQSQWSVRTAGLLPDKVEVHYLVVTFITHRLSLCPTARDSQILNTPSSPSTKKPWTQLLPYCDTVCRYCHLPKTVICTSSTWEGVIPDRLLTRTAARPRVISLSLSAANRSLPAASSSACTHT